MIRVVITPLNGKKLFDDSFAIYYVRHNDA